MPAVTTNLVIDTIEPKSRRWFWVAMGAKLPMGTMAFINASGYLTNTVGSGAYKFAGIVINEVDATLVGNKVLKCELFTKGVYRHLLFNGTATDADVGKPLYAIDNGTLQLSSTNASFVGFSMEKVNTYYAAIPYDALSVEINTKSIAA